MEYEASKSSQDQAAKKASKPPSRQAMSSKAVPLAAERWQQPASQAGSSQPGRQSSSQASRQQAGGQAASQQAKHQQQQHQPAKQASRQPSRQAMSSEAVSQATEGRLAISRANAICVSRSAAKPLSDLGCLFVSRSKGEGISRSLARAASRCKSAAFPDLWGTVSRSMSPHIFPV